MLTTWQYELLMLNPHIHSLLLDGSFNTKTNAFHSAPPLKDEDVKEIVETTAHRVVRMLKQRGVLKQNDYDEFAEEHPILARMTSASIIGLVSIGERAGQRVRRVMQDSAEGVKTGHLCFVSRGFSLHAATRIAAGNKDGFENLCNEEKLSNDSECQKQILMHFSWDKCYFYGHEVKCEQKISNYAGWTVEATWLLFELKVQGAHTSLAAGASLCWEVKWYLCDMPAGATATIGDTALLDYVDGIAAP